MKRLILTLCALAFASCVHNDPKARVVRAKLRNDDGKLVVIFRNIGKEVVSFDYTIADRANVPHVDSDGKNSGLVMNLYPGEERAMPEYPMQKSVIWPKIGRVTHGRKTTEELERMYRPLTAQQPGAMDLSTISTLGGSIDPTR